MEVGFAAVCDSVCDSLRAAGGVHACPDPDGGPVRATARFPQGGEW
ncbi:hypothetical protein [Rhodococcus sp. IEGM 1408]|nr:hypothetical protein [Rhodococcus sp. IEGM 1408]MDV7999718.1 hypothetical protein [Rhodococcus sp. IEGM 1408]